MSKDELKEEAPVAVQDNQGSSYVRFPKTRFPRLNAALRLLKSAYDAPGKLDPTFGWERDAEHHQVVIYVADPNFNITYLVKSKK